jgi:stage VI sporulation protein D
VDNRSGLLRFNIAEKVRLADSAASIEVLEEVELVPEVEVNIRGEHAVLKGYLLLTGTYEGVSEVDEANPSCQMEHRIPVEITLPLSRISQEDNIVVEIDNFDVDVTDPRTIIVTGSLVLSGVDTSDSYPTLLEESADADEMVFIDTVDDVQDAISYARQPVIEEVHSVARNTEEEEVYEEAQQRVVQTQTHEAEEILQEEEREPGRDDAVDSEPSIEQIEDLTYNEVLSEADPKKEVKIAFASKKQEQEPSEPIHLASALSRRPVVKPIDNEEGPDENSPRYSKESTGESLDWAKMLRKGEEELPTVPFKLRIGLVQPEDTLETLSQRFGVNAKEIALLNQINAETELRAGQVLYIPRTKPTPPKEVQNKRKANG